MRKSRAGINTRAYRFARAGAQAIVAAARMDALHAEAILDDAARYQATCPWCGSSATPERNREKDEKRRKLNPWKCADCGGVGGAIDFWSPEPEGSPSPDQCYLCGSYRTPADEAWTVVTIDLDPGDAEVGPQPNVQNVPVCAPCARRRG